MKWGATANFQDDSLKAETPFWVGGPCGLQVKVSPPKFLPCKPTPRSNFCLLAPAQLLKLIPSFGGVDPADPRSGWTPKNKILPSKPTPRSNFCLLALTKFSMQIPPFIGVEAAGPGLWRSAKKQNFLYKPTLRSNFCLLAPAEFSKHTPPIGEVDPAGLGLGWAPRNKILQTKPNPEKQLLFAGPRWILYLSWFFRQGHYILGRPLAWCQARLKWGAHAKFWGDG